MDQKHDWLDDDATDGDAACRNCGVFRQGRFGGFSCPPWALAGGRGSTADRAIGEGEVKQLREAVDLIKTSQKFSLIAARSAVLNEAVALIEQVIRKLEASPEGSPRPIKCPQCQVANVVFTKDRRECPNCGASFVV